ncbi:hypothetical protein quinque_004531 [Culex quinquefasciatus]
MEPTQDVASPLDQSQPATDPLAIEQPGQPEPPPPSAPETPSTRGVVDPQPQTPQQPAEASAQNESSPVESTSGESADKPAEPSAVDPLADDKPYNSNTGVSSSDGPVEPKLPEPSSSEVPAEAAVPKPTTANDTPTSSNNSYVGSSSNCIKDPVTGDNSLKINGISDLSILDVTQGNDADEIEVKVEGGSLMHKVIKFSLLNGMQDSSKRLENSRLIMSGVSSTKTANGGEATLATTSSLSLGGGPLRQDDKAKEEGFKGGTLDSKTTPPACSSSGMRPESVEPGSSFSTSSNSSDSSGGSPANNGSEEVKPNRTEEPRLRHSVDSNHSAESATPREESASDTFGRSASLDFREATTVAVAPKPPTPPTKETEPAAQPPQAEAKRPKAAMYYAELPDFSKPMFSAAPTTASTTSTAASTTTPSPQQQGRSLSQLQMKTPDFSRIVQAAAPPSAPQSSQPSSSISPAPSVSTSGAHRSHELQIANPDFSKSFGMASKPSSSEQSPYNMHPTSFAELSKQRNYISDLQLKNPSDPHPSVVKSGPSPPSTSSGPSLSNFRIEKPQVPKPYPPYRQEPGPATQQLEEPKAHVIHKASTSSTPHPEPAKPWNPAVDYRAADRSRYPPQQYQKGPPPLTSEPPHPGPHTYQGYPQYPPSKGKEPPTQQQTPVAAHPGGIIVNNVKTYYPEPPQQQQPQQHQPPKSKDAEFRLDYKEKQLRQEGTIITLKQNERQPPAQHQQSYPPQPHSSYHRSRSPSAERREAQMMASSQEILYRDFKLKQSYEMPPSPASSSRSPAPVAPRDRSPYDPYYRGGPPSKYYPEQQQQQHHQHHKQSPSPSATPSPTPMHSRNPSPVSKPVPPPPGQMHPPSSWPSQGRVVASPHGGGSANSSPQSASPNHYHPSQQKNSPSPVQQQHAYQQPPGQHYKSPSPSSSSSPSPYGAGPVPPAAGPVTKYTQYYPSVNGERIVSIEVDKEQYKPGYKGLDFNMEQKFAEVYQAHQMKEKQGSTSSVRPPGPEYARHPPGAQGHHAYKPQQDHKHQDQYRDEYGRSRAPMVNARYPPSQENLTHYSQQYQQYPPRSLPETDVRKAEQPHMMYPKPSSRDPSPGHKYNPSEVPRHPGYPPYSHPSSSKAPQHPAYPPGPGPAAGGEPSQYSLPAKSSYSPYDRPPDKQQQQHHQQPSVISNAYSSSSSSSSSRDERAGPPRAVYPESRPAEHYPPVSQYQTPPQPKPYPQPPRDPNWHYQQAPHHGQPPQAPQPGPSGYGPERPTMRDERQAPVIQPPMSKNIPVKVIATANSVPTAPASSTTIAPATSTTKRESPLDLSVKTVKTKADSTASDDYGHSSRSREVVPKVNFNPNFKKHIPERAPPAPQQAQPGPSQSYHVPREPQPIPPPHHPHPHSAKAPSGPPPPDHRQMPVINPAIPPGYDKKTDAYMSANYRAVGGSVDARYPHDSRYAPQGREHPVPYGIPPGAYPGPGSYPQRLPPGAPVPQHPYQLGPAPPKSEPYYPSGAKQAPSVSSRSVYYPPHETARSSKQQPPAQKSHMDDPRIEDRKFVESMLKKQASPSAEVIADLQAGKFSTRLPSTLAPAKKRPAETVPKTSPTKVARVEEPSLHRPYESNYRHPQYPGPAAPRDYYPVPIKHEPASPQPAGTYYSAEKRPEMPSITRGVLNTAQTHPSVLQPNVQRVGSHPIDTHPSVITSYHAAAASRPIEEHPRPSYSHLEERGQPFRHGDPKYYGAGPPPTSVEKPSPRPADRPDVVKQTSVLQMQSHIQYGGHLPPQQQQQQQPPMQYKRPEVVQQLVRPTNIVENHQARSYENIPRLISDAPKVSPDQRPTPPYHHSSQESLSPSGPSPQHRGADQSVISKLRNSLELKEQRNNQLRKQTSSEMSEEDNKPMDLNAFPPSHFRSKGAMKAYTPIPAFDAPLEQPQEQAPKPPSPVKQEPVEIPKEPIEPPADIEGASALDILDWGSACNEFVEQLQTGKKRGRRKRGIGAKRDNDAAALNDGFRADLPGTANSTLSEVPQEVLRSAAQEIGDFASSSDEDKPLVVLKQQQQSGTEDQLLAIRNSTMEKLTEKIARNMREKQRLEQEQRHEAKLGRSSSSESESDNRRVVQRAKMRARKLRNRQSVPLKSSDVNTDGEDEEEEEDQARDLRKRKKLDQTSSESEPEAQSKKLNRCQTQQIKQENGTDMSTDEEDPKTQSPGGKKDKRLEVKSESVKQGRTASDSESNDVKTNESAGTQAKNCKAEPQSSGSSESEKSEVKPKKRGPKKFAKPRTTSRSKVVEESSESEESSDEAETMTRSRSKLVLEKQKSNSKVLRNDKIVGNFVKDRKRHDSVTPQKGKKGMVNVKLEASKKRILDSDSDGKSVAGKKRIRKTSKLQTTSASDSSEESEAGHRLRTRKQKASESSAPSSATKRGTSQDGKGKGLDKKGVKSEPPKKRGRQPKKTSKDCATENTSENFYPGWEKELYEFKRSLKVPPQLITIGGRQYVHRISASLPDLDSHHSGDESETFSEIVKKINQKDAERVGKKVKTKAAAKHGAKNKEQQVEERKIEGNMKFSSIIELLHERMLRQRKLMAKGKKGKKGDDKDAVKVKSEFELLPTPGAESEALFNRKKKSLFDTAIFKSRTRTEQKVMQSKEIIREVFGGDDERPQSAPPLGCVKDLKNVTFDEVYNEMLNKTEHVASFLAQKKLQRDKAVASTSGGQSAVKVKIEDLDDETQDSVLKDSGRVTEEGDTPSVVSERDLATPVSFRGIGKKKTHKSRRKGSSGFDYIRKKKKPVPVNNGEHSTPVVPKKKIISAFENLQTKDESHINKEIRSWVLNKGVGESVMHKAARLGYTDVIVYCLERLEMDPDLKDNAGYTPLHEACAKGHLDICNYLLQYGASHSETAPSGIRPLHEAVENSFIEVVRLLLAFGADPMLATYAGQTPIQLAENNEMALFLENHLIDIQSLSSTKTGWKMDGSWKAHDFEESGCDLFADIPDFPHDESHNNSTTTERSSLSSSGQSTSDHCPPPPPPPPPSSQPAAKRCDSNSNIMNFEVPSVKSDEYGERKYKDCAVVLNDIHLNGATPTAAPYLNGQTKQVNGRLSEEESDEDGELGGEFVFEYEEADRPLPPLYLLKDDTAGDKWVLMTDLCNFLKLKSKEAVMKQICPTPTANATTNGTTTAISPPSNGTTTVVSSRELIRELKLEDFLTRASCLQLLCAGEKLNIHSNKVVLVKYNDNVRNLLQVQSHVAKI